MRDDAEDRSQDACDENPDDDDTDHDGRQVKGVVFGAQGVPDVLTQQLALLTCSVIVCKYTCVDGPQQKRERPGPSVVEGPGPGGGAYLAATATLYFVLPNSSMNASAKRLGRPVTPLGRLFASF